MREKADIHLLLSIAAWIGIGLTIGNIIYVALIRRRLQPPRADLPVTLILGLVGALERFAM